jgi:hypothetical protein
MRVFAMMCATAVALVPSGASATNWVEVSRGENGMVSYNDTDGIRVLGSGRVRGWVKRDLSRVRTERAREFRQQWEWNCTDQITTRLSYISYAPDGSVMNSETRGHTNWNRTQWLLTL